MEKKIKILYVDDEEMNVEIFYINFSLHFDVITAFNAQEGLDKLKENPDIKVVLSDIIMPDMDGIEFIKKAKSFHDGKSYFLVTGCNLNDDIQDSLNNNLVQKYFCKPFEVQEIIKEINLACQN